MNYKLLLLDVDGTLTASKADALPSQAVIEAVQTAQTKLIVALATGRPHEFAQPVIAALGLHGYGIFNGGAEIVDTTTNRLISRQELSITAARKVVSIALPYGYSVYSDESQYATAVSSADEVIVPAAKIFVEAVRIADVDRMLDELSTIDEAGAHKTSSWDDGDVVDVHITHHLASKRHGAEQLMKMLGIEADEVIAIGDSHNDLPLLAAAGLKIVMGNAPDDVKAVADWVAPSLNEDGVAAAIQRFILD